MLESAPFAAAPGTITITICAAPPATTIIRPTGTTISVFGCSAPNHAHRFKRRMFEPDAGVLRNTGLVFGHDM